MNNCIISPGAAGKFTFAKIFIINEVETDRNTIKILAANREVENDAFRSFLASKDNDLVDGMVQQLNEEITRIVDCTKCGACCQALMINVTKQEVVQAAAHLAITPEQFSESFVEESQQGQLIMNTIPCHFLAEKKCSIYEHRFAECRQFPHLDRKHFKDRLFGTLIHYAMCPIIFNVVEALKIKTGFKHADGHS